MMNSLTPEQRKNIYDKIVQYSVKEGPLATQAQTLVKWLDKYYNFEDNTFREETESEVGGDTAQLIKILATAINQVDWKLQGRKVTIEQKSKEERAQDFSPPGKEENIQRYRGRVHKSPFRYLPDCQNIEVKLPGKDELFGFFGIDKKIPGELKMTMYKNRRINRYISYVIGRMEKMALASKTKPEYSKKYWKEAIKLMTTSSTFRVMAIRETLPHWHRSYTLDYILYVNREVSRLINEKQNTLQFHRKYIPKGETDFRPLGIPTVPWRVLLHMYNGFLLHYCTVRGDLPDVQHGFRPHRGCLTAWRDFFAKGLHRMKYIYEYDLKNFFGDVNVHSISEQLTKWQIPAEIVNFLESINLSNVKLPKEQKLDEERVKARTEIFEKINACIEVPFHLLKPIIEEIGIEKLNEIAQDYGCTSYQESIQMHWALSPTPVNLGILNKGIAQGAPTSPFCATAALVGFFEKLKSKGYHLIAYADDAIVAANHLISIESDPLTGINIHKDGYVKKAGAWLKPLKFLGLLYDGLKDSLQGATRKGSTLKTTEAIKSLIASLDLLNKTYHEKVDLEKQKGNVNAYDLLGSASSFKLTNQSWDRTFKTHMMGLWMSRFYIGNWDQFSINQCFDLTYRKGSMLWKYCEKYITRNQNLTVFNSSSFAVYTLINIFDWNADRYRAKESLKKLGYILPEIWLEKFLRSKLHPLGFIKRWDLQRFKTAKK